MNNVAPFEAGRFLVREFEIEDISEAYLAALNNKLHMQFSRQKNLRHSELTSKSYLTEIREAGGNLLGIFSLQSRELKGTISVRPIENSASLGFLIFPRYSGQGLLSLIMPYLLRNLENNQDFEWFHVGTSKKNIAMQKVVLKSGFKVIGEDLIRALIGGSNQDYESDYIHFLKEFDAKR